MRSCIVADGYTIIHTQGIRYVEKKDVTYGGPTTHYRLVVTYKGNCLDFQYPDAASRDAQFAALSVAMTGVAQGDCERTHQPEDKRGGLEPSGDAQIDPAR